MNADKFALVYLNALCKLADIYLISRNDLAYEPGLCIESDSAAVRAC